MKQSGPPGNAESQQELKPQELPPLHHGKENEQLQKVLCRTVSSYTAGEGLGSSRAGFRPRSQFELIDLEAFVSLGEMCGSVWVTG